MSESLESFADRTAEITDLREALVKANQRLVKEKDRRAALVEAALSGARDAMLALGPVPPVPVGLIDKRKGGEEVALWHLTDWQGAKVTTSYNSQVMRERLMRFCEKARKITEIQRKDHPVRECVIAFGGDMGEGLFNFPTQPFEIDATIFEQFVSVSRLEQDVVRIALSAYEKVTVVPEWGNHGRIGSKRSAVPRSDNFDRMIHEMARQNLAGEERLTWQDCPEDEQRLEIGNYRALVIHGDEVGRNGYASPATIVSHVNDWKSGAYPWSFQDCYVGHYHNHSEYALADGLGAVYFTGSPESDNRYARTTMAAAGVPSQRLHFIDPEKGRVTAQYRVSLAD